MSNEDNKTKKLIRSAMFAALIFIATFLIKIPTPGTTGYVHPGDAFVILSGVFLTPFYSFFAAAIGSALSDLAGGYFIYVPITFFVKGLIGLICALIYRRLGKKQDKPSAAMFFCGITDIVLVVFGYGIPEIFLYGFAGAAASAFPNFVQGLSGLILAFLLRPLLEKALKKIS